MGVHGRRGPHHWPSISSVSLFLMTGAGHWQGTRIFYSTALLTSSSSLCVPFLSVDDSVTIVHCTPNSDQVLLLFSPLLCCCQKPLYEFFWAFDFVPSLNFSELLECCAGCVVMTMELLLYPGAPCWKLRFATAILCNFLAISIVFF